jgi:hypothetical protein
MYLFAYLFYLLLYYKCIHLFTSVYGNIILNSDVYVRFQVVTAASIKMIASLNTAPCSLVVVDRRFRGVY